MKLTPKPRSGPGAARIQRAPTTVPGYRNPNGQQIVARTNARSTRREGQVVYRLRCDRCGHEYGCNGLDLKSRRCPACQNGAPGEAVAAETTLPLFA